MPTVMGTTLERVRLGQSKIVRARRARAFSRSLLGEDAVLGVDVVTEPLPHLDQDLPVAPAVSADQERSSEAALVLRHIVGALLAQLRLGPALRTPEPAVRRRHDGPWPGRLPARHR